jgi:hypothetical protein
VDDNEDVNFPVGESLPNEFFTEVGCLAIQIFSQCLDDKPALVFCQELCRLWILTEY